MCENDSECLRMSTHVAGFVSVCLRMSYRMFQSVTEAMESHRMSKTNALENVSECFRMAQNASACLRMSCKVSQNVQNVSECLRTSYGMSCGMSQNVLERLRMSQNAAECSRIS